MKYKFSINGLDCPNCAAKLSGMIEADDKITACKINFLTERVTLETDIDEDTALTLAQGYAKKFSPSVRIEK